jgi:hypothetical protein
MIPASNEKDEKSKMIKKEAVRTKKKEQKVNKFGVINLQSAIK